MEEKEEVKELKDYDQITIDEIINQNEENNNLILTEEMEKEFTDGLGDDEE